MFCTPSRDISRRFVEPMTQSNQEASLNFGRRQTFLNCMKAPPSEPIPIPNNDKQAGDPLANCSCPLVLALDMDCGLNIYFLAHVPRGVVRRRGRASGKRDGCMQCMPSEKWSSYLEHSPSPTQVRLASPCILPFPQRITNGLGSTIYPISFFWSR